MYDELVQLFGGILSELLNKPKIACSGLLRFAIKDYEKTKEILPGKFLKLEDFHLIINENIRTRLESINFSNIDGIISKMLKELYNHQAIFTFL